MLRHRLGLSWDSFRVQYYKYPTAYNLMEPFKRSVFVTILTQDNLSTVGYKHKLSTYQVISDKSVSKAVYAKLTVMCACKSVGRSWTHIHEQVRRGRALAAHGAGAGWWRMSHTHYTRGAGGAGGAVSERSLD